MKKLLLLLLAVILAVPAMQGEAASRGRITSENVTLPRHNPAVLYAPANGKYKKVAFLTMHSNENYLSFAPGPELAKRGYLAMNANVSQSDSSLKEKMLDVAGALAYLRSLPGVEKVVLVGHSGGATLMSAYQAIAENGIDFLNDNPKRLVTLTDKVQELSPADGIVFIDANWGNGPMTLFSTDAAVVSEADGRHIDASLDSFSEENGYDKAGAHYSEAFRKKYLAAQRKRYMSIVSQAESRLEAIEQGEGAYSDDEPLVIPGSLQRAFNNKLYPFDTSLMAHTEQAYPILHADGSTTVEIVHSVRLPLNAENTSGTFASTTRTTVRNFLSNAAIAVGSDYDFTATGATGIYYRSNITTPIGNAEGIHVPLLAMGMTGNWEYLAAESIYKHAASADKSIAFVEGATHMLTPNEKAEKALGVDFGDTVKNLFDYVDSWTKAHI